MKPGADVIASVDRYTDKTLKIMSLMSKFDMADREDVELRPWEQGKLDVNRRPVPPYRGTEVDTIARDQNTLMMSVDTYVLGWNEVSN